ncbi:MAG: succinate dehydrogenase iron-sulfur subunit [Deltaproteobacteria bacterium]|nr:succinate dehydrogenase iron-sulfur subunit [Deltaproteobacteria bacterium]
MTSPTAEIRLEVRRQDGPGARARWEEFLVPGTPGMNVISCLRWIQANPVDSGGRPTTPVAWDCNCLEEVCGACSMLINGRARQACTALVDELQQPVRLEPLSKFPLVRVLVVDRAVLFEHLKRILGWISIDGLHDVGPGPRVPEKQRRFGYRLSGCMTCGSCVEACPQVSARTRFMGPAALAQAVYFNLSPLGRIDAEERLEAVMGEGGISQCANAQNCDNACPRGVPLTTAIARLNRATSWHLVREWLAR